MFKNFLLVGLGGAIGSMLRYGISILYSFKHFPAATFTVNILGSFFIGIIMAISIKDETFFSNWKLFLATGICGGFTTFSAFSAENVQLLQNGKIFSALIYTTLSILLGIVAAWIGFKLINNQ